MKRTFKGAVWSRASPRVALFAGLAAAGAGSLEDRKAGRKRRRHEYLELEDHPPPSTNANPEHQDRIPPPRRRRNTTPPSMPVLTAETAGEPPITCRPFDASLALYQKRQLDGLDDLKGHGQFFLLGCRQGPHGQTDDGKTDVLRPRSPPS